MDNLAVCVCDREKETDRKIETQGDRETGRKAASRSMAQWQ